MEKSLSKAGHFEMPLFTRCEIRFMSFPLSAYVSCILTQSACPILKIEQENAFEHKCSFLHYYQRTYFFYVIRNIDDYRFNRKCCLLFDLKCTFKKIFSNCDHCMPNTGLNHFISGTVSTLQLKMELFMFKLIINIRQRVMYFVLGCYLRKKALICWLCSCKETN
ncbi:hypothetical protein T02_13770 [Trichinella nativa]|uniref:Uncharacterized protein n=1 Tax=Trichinella nativa TaxID=6335 RepID=A0A0V1L1F8_9BILA|nr:hypothetical protein T02_13770 [Trichinella nativa]